MFDILNVVMNMTAIIVAVLTLSVILNRHRTEAERDKRIDRILDLTETKLEISKRKEQNAEGMISTDIKISTEELKDEIRKVPLTTSEIVRHDVIEAASGVLQKSKTGVGE